MNRTNVDLSKSKYVFFLGVLGEPVEIGSLSQYLLLTGFFTSQVVSRIPFFLVLFLRYLSLEVPNTQTVLHV